MPDARPAHHTVSLMNQPTPPFHGAGHALYSERGPQRSAPDYRARKPLSDPPESLAHHIEDAIARVGDLSPKQRNSLKAAMLAMTRDISFIKLIGGQQGQGPQQDEGRLL